MTALQTGATTSSMIREPSGTLTGMTRNGAAYPYFTDAQGSVTTVVDNAGQQVDAYTYTPYRTARTTTETVPQPWRYTGGDPVNHTDPNGTFSFADIAGGVVGTVVGGAAAVGVFTACGATAGVACLGAAAVAGGLWGTLGGATGSLLAGGSQDEVANGARGGLIGGITSGAIGVLF
ncbi:hypothetical protein [Kitasatospora sp. NPDC057198]|uniref:hypothetical protein n=1 Tax=Kitasatospora sp. NPDC057198 TaxID=3346046 RepID=UPI00363BFA0E